jgi:23S rRNA pseudouridine2605 synthase
MERLHKYLARCGVASRRAAEELISAGRVALNGHVVGQPGSRVDPDRDLVQVDDHPVQPPKASVYLALNKPRGTVTTTDDPWGRPTVVDLAPKGRRLFPVGRLDRDSEGLLLLTDDGELANRLMHPRYGCEKEYRALVRGAPSAEILARLRGGIQLDDGLTAPAEVELADTAEGGRQWLRVTLREGRNRQVRRMLAAVGVPVERLVRVRIGSLHLGDLPAGVSRALTADEVAALSRRRVRALTRQAS